MQAYQGVRNVSFSENFMYVLNGLFLKQQKKVKKKAAKSSAKKGECKS